MIKIISAVVVTLVVAIGVGLLGLVKLSNTSADVNAMYMVQVKPLGVLATAQRTAMQARVDLLVHATSLDPASMSAVEARMKANDAALAQQVATYRASAAAPSIVDAFTTDWAAAIDLRDRVLLPLSRANKPAEFQRARETQFGPAADKAFADFDRAFEAESAQAALRAGDADAAFRTARTMIIFAIVVGGALALVLGIMVARQIVRALRRVSAVTRALAAGNLTVRADVAARDELGLMADDLDRAVASLRETITSVGENAVALAASSEELSTTSTQIAAAAEETSAQAGTVSQAAGQVDAGIATVAASSEEMGASIREISANSSEAARVAAEAVEVAAATTGTIGKLGESSTEISNVVKTITAIAEQTNLLALNATIEAARAGEAGKGFAVVASEVKDLAQETARATGDISERVQTIQANTSGAVTAIEQITAVIHRISEFQTTIASAVEEQTATTAEVARSISDAAGGARDISANVDGVAQAAQTTAAAVTQAQAATEELARMSTTLQRVVAQFAV
ncbi:methyl-accepting chemotaxis protein [Couchioplanes caeruleus]|uniref:methyl-accepting chemotaxis protein n=1 Tax=Couchioplanes caeruleus TaxID=56438 RepID=UPI003D311CD4